MTAPATTEATTVNIEEVGKYPTVHLQKAFVKIDEELQRRRNVDKVRQNLIKQAKEAGVEIEIKNVDDAFAGEVPKYRNPDDHLETWGGHGRQPKWLKKAMKATSKPLEYFEVKDVKAEPPKPEAKEPPIPVKQEPPKQLKM